MSDFAQRFTRILNVIHLAGVAILFSVAVLPTSNDAIRLARDDARTLPEYVRSSCRYVWITDGDPVTARAVSLTQNYVSRGVIIERPVPIGKDKLLLVRFDLRKYSFRESDFREQVQLWEEYQNDPMFSRFFTKDTIKFNHILVLPKAKHWVEQTCPEYVHTDGKKYTSRWAREEFTPTIADLEKIAVIRTPSEVLDREVFLELCDLTGSEAPVVSHPYFVHRTLTTIQDDGVFKEIWGGLYYELVGFKQDVKGKTDLDGIFESIGLKDVDKFFEDLRSDRKVAILHSAVTGRKRAIKIFPSPASQDGGIVRISEDIQQSSVDIGNDPFMNLLKNLIDGQELIFTGPNKLHRFAALNGKRKLVREVPNTIASDRTIPAPHPPRLQGAMSCIVCHGPSEGVQPITNDILKISKVTNILGDQGRLDQVDANQRIAGLYSGDPDKGDLAVLLTRVKDDYASAVLRATGPWPGSKDQTDVSRLAAAKLGEIRNRYYYDLVTPAQALTEIGIEPGVDAVKTLKASILVNPGPIGLEDARFAPLLAGIGISRFDWDLQRDFVAVRVTKGVRK